MSQSASSRSLEPIPPPTRRSAPPINYKVRGVIPTTELTEADRQAHLDALQKDKIAPSTAEGRETHRRTWTTLHVRWFGQSTPVLPLTTSSIHAVASQMKLSGYRTFPNYMTAMKALHCTHYAWTEELDHCRREVIKSTQRGIGPARQCMELPVSRIAELQLDNEPLAPSGPICPMEWALLSSFHMLRGAESAVALADAVSINSDTLTETWILPVSKTDVQAAGCQRTWGCVCKGPEDQSLCPYHAAIRLKQEVRRRFGDATGSLPLGCPLFPDEFGGWCSKKGFTNTIAVMATRLNLPTVDALERSTVGEHVWRVTGARHLAALDVPIPIIKLLARWGSDVVERYVAEAPLSALTRIYVERVQASDAAARGLAAAASVQLPHDIASLYSGKELSGRAIIVEGNASGEPSWPSPFVSSITNKVHLVSLPPSLGVRLTGRTPCGWAYSDSEHKMLHDIPAGAKCCERCGNEGIWSSVHALISQIHCGYDSE
jgi:hypothetical protein